MPTTPLQGQFSLRYTQFVAGVLVSSVPVLVIFVFLQRYLISGFTSGSDKS